MSSTLKALSSVPSTVAERSRGNLHQRLHRHRDLHAVTLWILTSLCLLGSVYYQRPMDASLFLSQGEPELTESFCLMCPTFLTVTSTSFLPVPFILSIRMLSWLPWRKACWENGPGREEERLARDIVISKVRGIVKQTEVEKCYVNLFILKIKMFSKFSLILRRGAKDLNLSKWTIWY